MPHVSRAIQLARDLGTLDRHEWRFLGEAWALAPVVAVCLKVGGLKQTVALIDRLGSWPARRKRTRQRDPDPGEAARLVQLAFRMHLLLHGSCLQRSLVQYLLHRLRRTPARLVVGVRREGTSLKPGLAAHAWVEPVDAEMSDRPDGFVDLYSREVAP